MTDRSLDDRCHAFALQMFRSAEPFVPFEGDINDFCIIAARILELYGGSLGESFLLRHYCWIKKLRSDDLYKIVELMLMNRVMGVDVLLEFYARFTRVPSEDFGFLKGLSVADNTINRISLFREATSREDFGGWHWMTADEAAARRCESNDVPLTVIGELKEIDSLQ